LAGKTRGALVFALTFFVTFLRQGKKVNRRKIIILTFCFSRAHQKISQEKKKVINITSAFSLYKSAWQTNQVHFK
jgi:hypothetical protein